MTTKACFPREGLKAADGSSRVAVVRERIPAIPERDAVELLSDVPGRGTLRPGTGYAS